MFHLNNVLIFKGQRIEFLYDHPKRGHQHRCGKINKVYNAKDGKAIFNIRDTDRQGEFRSFHHDKMFVLSLG